MRIAWKYAFLCFDANRVKLCVFVRFYASRIKRVALVIMHAA